MEIISAFCAKPFKVKNMVSNCIIILLLNLFLQVFNNTFIKSNHLITFLTYKEVTSSLLAHVIIRNTGEWNRLNEILLLKELKSSVYCRKVWLCHYPFFDIEKHDEIVSLEKVLTKNTSYHILSLYRIYWNQMFKINILYRHGLILIIKQNDLK